MNKSVLAGVIALVGFAGVALAALSTNQGPDRVPHSHGGNASAGAGHDGHAGHAMDGMHDHTSLLSLPAGPTAPTLETEIAPDPMSGWNLRIETSNFRFSPENASGPHQPGEGHAHVYINGHKLARVYGPWFHLDALPKGETEVTVTLNSNDHRTLAVEDRPLRVTQTVTVE